MVSCKICSHEQRYDIESALLNLPEVGKAEQLSLIADTFDVALNDLKIHALMHMGMKPAESLDDPLKLPNPRGDASNEENSSVSTYTPNEIAKYCDEGHAILINPDGSTSLATQMKLREAEMLIAVANEYLLTLKTVGRKINGLANKANEDEIDGDIVFSRLITKPMVDLYIGAGAEIRATIKTIADINQLLNGKEDDQGSAGLKALAEALKASQPSQLPQTLNFINVDGDGGQKNSTTFVVDPVTDSEAGADE